MLYKVFLVTMKARRRIGGMNSGMPSVPARLSCVVVCPPPGTWRFTERIYGIRTSKDGMVRIARKDAALHDASFEVLINESMLYLYVVSMNPTHHNSLSAPGRNCKAVQILPESVTESSLSVPRFY